MTHPPDPYARWPNLDTLFVEAIEKTAGDRAAWLADIAARDPDLRRELEGLLAAHAEAGGFMEDPVAWFGELVASHPAEKGWDSRWLGRTVGQYEILERLGAGGMGVVFRARDKKLKRQAALKFLRPHIDAEPGSALRFLNEAQAASALDHPGICTIYEIGEGPGGEPYIAMAYYEGETLGQRLARGAIPVDEALTVARQIGDGLVRAHEAGIIHRDLKPANLMLTERGEVKILDFGIAKLAGGPAPDTRTGARLGTVAYMSPEQARGEPVDHRTDVWALGVVLHEMVTGIHPFRGTNDTATLTAILRADPEPVRTGLPGLEAVLRTALAPLPDRFEDMPAMLEALNALSTGQALPPIVWRRRFARRKRLAIVLAAAVALITGVILSWPGGAPAGPDAMPRLIVLPFDNLGDPANAYFAEGLTDEIIQRLASLGDVKVLARTTAHRVRAAGWSLSMLSDSLGVSHALEGTVRWASTPAGGGRVRITANFVDVREGTTLWTEPLEADFANVFRLQDEIAERVAGRLRVRLPGAGQAAASVVPAAYQAYLLGQYHWNKRTAEGLRVAADYFERSIAADSMFPNAWAGLANTFGLFPTYGVDDLQGDEAMARAESAVERALELDPELAEAHLAQGMILSTSDWDWAAAAASLETAIRLRPQLAQAFHWHAEVLYILGAYADAERAVRQAVDLDPLSPVANNTLGWLLRVAGRPDEAIPYLERAHELSPDFPFPHFNLTAIDARAGRMEAARTHLLRTVESFGMDAARADTVAQAIGAVDAAAADRAVEVLERWAGEPGVPSILIASLLDIITTREYAMPWVLEAFRQRFATPMDVVWLLRKYRADPRAAAVLVELGLEGT